MILDGMVIVVTGAGSGIGRALSRALAERGAFVAACDLDGARANETVESLVAPGGGQHAAFAVDVCNAEAMTALADQVIDRFGHVDAVVNNAGVMGTVAPVDQLSLAEMRWVVDVDLWGVINGTRAFLPHLRTRPAAAIVNVSSLAGLTASVANSAYFAAKFGVRGFTEAVRAELRTSSIVVTVVHPGLVRTNLASSSMEYTEEERREAVRRYNAQPGMSPERAAAGIVRAIERGRPRALIGPDARLLDKVARLLPGSYDAVLGPVARRAMNKQRPDGRKVF